MFTLIISFVPISMNELLFGEVLCLTEGSDRISAVTITCITPELPAHPSALVLCPCGCECFGVREEAQCEVSVPAVSG